MPGQRSASLGAAAIVVLALGCGGARSEQRSAETAGEGGAHRDRVGPPCEPVSERPVTAVGLFSFAPVLAPGPDGFGLLFTQRAADGRCENERVLFARLGYDGHVLGPPAVLTSNAAGNGPGELFWTGDEYVATFLASGDDGVGVYLQRIKGDGAITGEPRLLMAGVVAYEMERVPGGFALVWASPTDMSLTYLDAWGRPAGNSGPVAVSEGDRMFFGATLVTTPNRWFRLARTEGAFALAWAANGYNHVRVSAQGRPVGDPVRVCCPPSHSWSIGGPPGLAPLPDGSAMAWMNVGERQRPLMLSRFDAGGALLGQVTLTGPAWTAHPVLAPADDGIAVAWRDDRTGQQQIYYARVDANLARRAANDTLVTSTYRPPGCDEADALSLVSDRGGHALAWSDGRAGSAYEIYFAVVCPERP